MQHKIRYRLAKRITLIGAIVNALFSVLKIVSGVLFHSHGLVADGVHSLADLITDAMVLIASKYSNQEADEDHPYGHQRIETATTLFLSLALILAGAGIAWDAFSEIMVHQHTIPQTFALPIAILSILVNEGLFHYTKRIGEHIKSDLIIANAWHRRSDALSSLVVLAGLIGALLGYTGLDAGAAIVVSILIIKMGINYGWSSVKQLIDTAVDPARIRQIESIIKKIDGVIKIHQLRSRSMGSDIFVDVHIQVWPWISVSEGHFIAQHVHQTLMDHISAIKDVTVHVDPEDDEISNPSLHLTQRKTLEQTWLHPLQAAFPEVQNWVLHYLDGKITVDLFCQEPITPTLVNRIQTEIKHLPEIKTVRVFNQVTLI